jgi:hypothetical protein
MNVAAFCDLWELDEGDLYKALGDLRKKEIVVSISSQMNLNSPRCIKALCMIKLLGCAVVNQGLEK